MITVSLNNEILSIVSKLSLAALLAERKISESHFAIVINQHFVPRSTYQQVFLQEGDVIDLIAPMQGG
jgi:thiamine biosynthesis protein ThiS